MTISIWKILNFYILLSQTFVDNCSTLSSSCHFFCHLLESGLARINWIRANDKICVEQLICCQKCRANACRAIAIRAVHPHSNILHNMRVIHFQIFEISSFIFAASAESRTTLIKNKSKSRICFLAVKYEMIQHLLCR